MQTRRAFVILPLVLLLGVVRTQAHATSSSQLRAVELDYRVVPDFLKLPSGLYFSEVSGVALNSKGHIFVFQRGMHPLVEFDKSGRFEAVTIPERANGRTVVGFAGLDE